VIQRLALLLTLAAAISCTPEPPSTDLVMEPVADLVALRDGEAAFPSLPACAAGDETRPAVGCLFPTRLGVQAGLVPEAGVIRGRRYTLPPQIAGAESVLIERGFRRGEPDGWSWLAPELVHRPGPEIELSYSLPPDAPAGPLEVSARASVVPPSEQTMVTRPVQVGRGAVLTVGLAEAPIVLQAGTAPVEARVLARSRGGEREILRVVVDPADGQPGWHDHRVALDTLAGESVRFVLTTRPSPGAPAAAPVAPLWGAPRVLEPRPRRGAHNLILVSLDTLRADAVGAYGSELPTTPALDRLATEGALFEHVSATYPSTPGSHMSMMTGVYANAHGVIGPLDTLPTDVPTLAELLAARGWQTGAVTEDGMLVAGAGFQRGFAYYRENKGASIWAAAGQVDATFRNGLRWLEAHRDEKVFLFLHTYQVHEPYSPPPEFDRFRTYRDGDREVAIDGATPGAIRDRHAYAGEALYTDHEAARLLEGLGALGLAERTLVVFTSDHGEEFGEHRWKGHDETLYDEVLRVPLIMRAPGLVPAGVRVRHQASLVDLAPTLLELLGVPPPRTLHGRSLVPFLRRPDDDGDGVVFAELVKRKKGRRFVAARTPTRKWIWHEPPDVPAEVYDLAADPGERQNIATPALLAEGEALRRRYEALGRGATLKPAPATTTAPTLDPETERKLKALGYVE
jgi:arylsulfatase A-like enzyme